MTKEYPIKWKEEHPNHRVFGILVENELAGVWFFHPEVDNPGFLAALASNPTIMELTSFETIPIAEMGYVWNGVEFEEPKDDE